MSKDMLLLTLASNGREVVVPRDNIAFALEMEGENEKKEKETFTRVFLKQFPMDDECKWLDVKETPREIRRMRV